MKPLNFRETFICLIYLAIMLPIMILLAGPIFVYWLIEMAWEHLSHCAKQPLYCHNCGMCFGEQGCCKCLNPHLLVRAR